MSTRTPERPGRPDRPDGAAPSPRSDRHPVAWLLLVPLVVTLIPPFYNRVHPTLFHIPFFYWYQLAAIVLSVVITLVVYRALRRTSGH